MKIEKLIFILVAIFSLSCTHETFDPDKQEMDLTIYPNPIRDIAVIEMTNKPSGVAYIKIDNNDGSVMSIETEKDRVQVDFSELESGAYSCEVLIEEYLYKRTILKE